MNLFLRFHHNSVLLLSTVYVLFTIYVVYLGLGSRLVLINIIFSPIFVANKTNVVYFNLNGPWKPRRQILNSGILWLEFWRTYKWLYLFRKTNYPCISKAHLASIIRNSKVCKDRKDHNYQKLTVVYQKLHSKFSPKSPPKIAAQKSRLRLSLATEHF